MSLTRPPHSQCKKGKQVGATRDTDFITAQYCFKLASLSNSRLASSHFPLSTFIKEASRSLWQLSIMKSGNSLGKKQNMIENLFIPSAWIIMSELPVYRRTRTFSDISTNTLQ